MKSFGLGLGVAILVDALLVRLVLVPAIMHLLARHAWSSRAGSTGSSRS